MVATRQDAGLASLPGIASSLLASRIRWKLAPEATCFPDGVLQHMRSHLRPSDWVDGLLAPPLQRLASRIPQARIWPSAGRVACRMTRTLDSSKRATAE